MITALIPNTDPYIRVVELGLAWTSGDRSPAWPSALSGADSYRGPRAPSAIRAGGCGRSSADSGCGDPLLGRGRCCDVAQEDQPPPHCGDADFGLLSSAVGACDTPRSAGDRTPVRAAQRGWIHRWIRLLARDPKPWPRRRPPGGCDHATGRVGGRASSKRGRGSGRVSWRVDRDPRGAASIPGPYRSLPAPPDGFARTLARRGPICPHAAV